jgi:hypothetical protein
MTYIPGPNGIVWFRNGGVWGAMSSLDKFMSAGAWVIPKVLYQSKRTPADITNGTCTWTSIASWIAPTTAPPGASLAKRPTSQITYGCRATWTAITDTSDDRYGFSVSVNFHDTTTGTIDNVTIDQSFGSADSPAWAQLDDVYAVLQYVNDNGTGSSVTTSDVILGP